MGEVPPPEGMMAEKLRLRLDELGGATLSGDLDDIRHALENYACAMCEQYGDADTAKVFAKATHRAALLLPHDLAHKIKTDQFGV